MKRVHVCEERIMHDSDPIPGAARRDMLRERARAALAGVAVGPMVPRQKLGNQQDDTSRWLTLTQYARRYGVSVAVLEEGIKSGKLYAPSFYSDSGESRVRHDLVELWRRPAREGTFAASGKRWSLDVQLVCNTFTHYLRVVEILFPEVQQQCRRIIAAFEHAIHRTLTVREAESAVDSFLACLDHTLPAGPPDLVKAPSGADYFTPRHRPARPIRQPSSTADIDFAAREAGLRVHASHRRLAIAQRALCVYWSASPSYMGHLADRETITKVRASLAVQLNREARRHSTRIGMSPEHYVVWCDDRKWDPFTGKRLNKQVPREERYAHLPSLFSPDGYTPEDQKLNYNWARRHANVSWLEEAVDSLHDLEFWEFNNQEEANMIGWKMRLKWREENNPYGRFS
jgi:hypothetical protein